MKFITYLIFTFYLISLIKNIFIYIHKSTTFNAIKKKTKLKLSKQKILDLSNEYDFIKLLVLFEHIRLGEMMFNNPSDNLIKCSNILTNKDIENQKEFIIAEKVKILIKLNNAKKILLIKIIIAIFVLLLSFIIILK